MALPKLQSLPSYRVTIPSSGQETSYRPFLVKEQKALMIALETQERSDLLRGMNRLIEACIEEPIKSPLTTFDVDYLFTLIRSKSVGETVEVQLPCTECGTKKNTFIELDKIKVSPLDANKHIVLNSDVTLRMRFPSYEEFFKSKLLEEGTSQSEMIFELILICIDAVLTEEEQISIKDEKREDVINFIESMTTDQYEKLAVFASDIPYIFTDIEFDCSNCGTNNKHTLKGIDDFF